MKCPKCNEIVNNREKFCSSCGSKFNKDEMGVIVINRPKKATGCAISFEAFIDGEKVDSVGNGKTFCYDNFLGSHKVSFKTAGNKEVGADVELTKDKREVTVVVVPKMGLLVAKPSIKEVTYK